MSNYNSTLQSNNTDLQAILNTINELPEANGDPILQDKTVTPTTSQQTITADSGYDGLDTVTITSIPSDYEKITMDNLVVHENGYYDCSNYRNIIAEVSPSTCNVTITSSKDFIYNCYYVTVDVDGTLLADYNPLRKGTTTLENVVRKSMLIIGTDRPTGYEISTVSNLINMEQIQLETGINSKFAAFIVSSDNNTDDCSFSIEFK